MRRRYLANGRVYLLIKNLLPSSECCFVAPLEAATKQRFCKLKYVASNGGMIDELIWNIEKEEVVVYAAIFLKHLRDIAKIFS
jgi:hypothetical protein